MELMTEVDKLMVRLFILLVVIWVGYVFRYFYKQSKEDNMDE